MVFVDPGAATVKLKLVVWVTPPPVPVTVMVEVPVGVVEDVLMVKLVEQVGEHAVEENNALAPVGNPEAEKDTDCVVPDTSAALMELETEAPWLTALLPPFVSEKLKEVDAGFTVKLKLVVLATAAAIPFTVMVEVPMGVVEDVLMVRAVEQVGVHAVGENAAVAPVGNPEAEKVTACAVPDTSAALMELATEAPWLTALLPPFVSEKLKAEGAPTPFFMVKWSWTDPLLFKNLASNWGPLTSNTSEPSTLSDRYSAGWSNAPPLVCPSLPSPVSTA